MDLDNALGRAYKGFVEADNPLNIRQNIDELLADKKKKKKKKGAKKTTSDETVLGRLKNIFPTGKQKDPTKDSDKNRKPENEVRVEGQKKPKTEKTEPPVERKKSIRQPEKISGHLKREKSADKDVGKRDIKPKVSGDTKKRPSTYKRGKATPEEKKPLLRFDKTDTTDDESSKGSDAENKALKTAREADESVPRADKKPVILTSEPDTIVEVNGVDYEIPLVYFERAGGKKYRKRNSGLGRCFTTCCPCLSRLIFSERGDFRGLKGMLGFPIGLLFGYGLHKLVLERLDLSPYASTTLGSILALCLGIGYALSTQVRCICCLTIPGLCGKAGRKYLSTFIITFVIIGPVGNISGNAQESMRVMTCIGALNLNHTVERFKLMFKPVKDIIWDFVGAGEKINHGTKSIEGAYNQIENEVRDEEEVKKAVAETEELDKEIDHKSRVGVIKKKFSGLKGRFGEKSESQYGMKSELRCEGIFTKGVKGCYKSFGAAYDRCHHHLPIIGYLLCWPMKLTFICDLAGSFLGRRSCDSVDAMSPGFGESLETAEGVQREFDQEFGVSLQYKLDIPVEKVDQITPQDIGASVQHQFEKRKRSLDFFLNLINRLLALTFLQVFNASRKYCNKFLRSIEYDNKYISSYFRHIDARRNKEGKRTLLPLLKGEQVELSEPFKVKFSKEEKGTMILNALCLLSELMMVTILISFDWIFYEFLMLIQRHSHVTYYQTGVHHIKMTVYGDGFMGNMVRSILKGFDKKHSTDEVTNTAECLPNPTKLDRFSIIVIYVMFFVVLFLMLFEAYALRTRRVICSFFYPKREKKRILFLYNDRLKKRKSYLKFMRHRIRKMARKQAIALDMGVLFSLRHLYPRLFSWLGKLGLGKKKCLVCEEVETRDTLFITCPGCPFSHCPQCWEDVKKKCHVCTPDDEYDTPLSDEDFDDDDDDDD